MDVKSNQSLISRDVIFTSRYVPMTIVFSRLNHIASVMNNSTRLYMSVSILLSKFSSAHSSTIWIALNVSNQMKRIQSHRCGLSGYISSCVSVYDMPVPCSDMDTYIDVTDSIHDVRGGSLFVTGSWSSSDIIPDGPSCIRKGHVVDLLLRFQLLVRSSESPTLLPTVNPTVIPSQSPSSGIYYILMTSVLMLMLMFIMICKIICVYIYVIINIVIGTANPVPEIDTNTPTFTPTTQSPSTMSPSLSALFTFQHPAASITNDSIAISICSFVVFLILCVFIHRYRRKQFILEIHQLIDDNDSDDE